MKRFRYSILVDRVRNIYIPQYSRDGVCWYSFQNVEHGYTVIFRTEEEARKFLVNPDRLVNSVVAI